MSEQTANLCTTDACESLRARLAKYEDAEGNPVSTIEEQAREIAALRKIISECATACGAAVSVECSLEFMAMLPKEIALKAQPSGVVLPERWSVPRPIWKDARQPYGDPLNKSDIEAAGKFNLALDEVARLNSSPASAGEPVYQFQCREIGEGGFDACDHDRYIYCQKSPEHDTRVVQVGLQAPSHGEQVRVATVSETLADRFLSWPLPASVRPDPCAMNPDYPYRYGTNLLTWAQARAMFDYVLATPSAGSQE
ncbi:MAG: hypothetical protein ACKVIS_17435 [Pseudomonadales bacterium]